MILSQLVLVRCASGASLSAKGWMHIGCHTYPQCETAAFMIYSVYIRVKKLFCSVGCTLYHWSYWWPVCTYLNSIKGCNDGWPELIIAYGPGSVLSNLVLIHRTALWGRYSMISSILQIGKLSLWRDLSNSIYLRMDRTRAKTKQCLPDTCTLVSSGFGSPVDCVCIFSASSLIIAWQQSCLAWTEWEKVPHLKELLCLETSRTDASRQLRATAYRHLRMQWHLGWVQPEGSISAH